MTVISNLVVQLKGSTGNLDTALDKSGKKVSSFAQSGAKAGKSFSSFTAQASSGVSGLSSMVSGGLMSGLSSIIAATGPIGIVIGVVVAATVAVAALTVGVLALGKSFMSSIETTSHMADELGIGYNSLVSLQHAAEMTGGSAEGMNTALRHLEANMSAASHGSADMNKNLAQLGLTADQMKGMSVDQQFYTLADALSKVENQGDKVRLSQELLGREGAMMINSLKGGSAGLEAFKKEAEELGLTLDKESIQKVKEGNAAWKKMQASLTGVGNSLAVFVAPAIKWVADKLVLLVETLTSVGRVLAAIFAPAVQWVADKLVLLVGNITMTNDVWDTFWRGAIRTVTWFQTGFQKFGTFMSLVWDQTVFGLSRFVSQAIYAFTTTIPALFQAFGEFAGTFFTNLWENIKNGWDALWDDKDFQWKGLTDGWDAALNKLKGKVGNAPLTDFEKQMQDKIDKEKKELGDAWSKNFDEAWKNWKMKNGVKDDGSVKGEGGKGNAIDKGTAFAEEGSQEAFKILANQQGDKMYALQNKQLQELRDHNKKLDKLLTAWANAQPVAAARIGR